MTTELKEGDTLYDVCYYSGSLRVWRVEKATPKCLFLKTSRGDFRLNKRELENRYPMYAGRWWLTDPHEAADKVREAAARVDADYKKRCENIARAYAVLSSEVE